MSKEFRVSMVQEGNEVKKADVKDFLANERTYLAWIRTCIGVMAFGFIIERFALFGIQMAHYFEQLTHTQAVNIPTSNQVSYFGITLIALGAILAIFSYIRYRRVDREIRENNFKSIHILSIILTIAVVLMGAFLIVYLWEKMGS